MSNLPSRIKQAGDQEEVSGLQPAIVNRSPCGTPSTALLKSTRRLWICLIASVLFCASVYVYLWPATVGAATPTPGLGALDPSFGTNGKVFLDLGGSGGNSIAYAVTLQPDGKAIVAGGAGGNDFAGGSDIAVARLNPDGSHDDSFGTGGFVRVDIDNTGENANAVALQSDGKIVVAGMTYNFSVDQRTDFALVRLNSDGSLDSTFGNNGKVRTDFGNVEEAFGLVVQADQKLVVVGYTGDFNVSSLALARYNKNGSLDSTFGTGGKVVTDFNRHPVAYAVALQPDGKIVAAGRNYDPDTLKACFALIRYNPDGSIDSTFGSGGRVATSVFETDIAEAVAIQWDGKIVIAGSLFQSPRTLAALLRYNPDGSLDPSFVVVGDDFNGTGGFATSVVVQPDNKIIAAGGYGSAFNESGWALARYNPNGSVDSTFGVDGYVKTTMGTNDNPGTANAAVLQLDGRLVVIGRAYVNGRFVFGIARYIVDPSLKLLTEDGSERAIAFDSVTLTRDPFPVSTTQNFSSDRHTRVSFFAVNLALNPGEDASAVTAQAEDPQHGIHPLMVEFVGDVPSLYGVTQVNVRLSDDLTNAGDLRVSIRVHGVPSNKALISIKPQ